MRVTGPPFFTDNTLEAVERLQQVLDTSLQYVPDCGRRVVGNDGSADHGWTYGREISDLHLTFEVENARAFKLNARSLQPANDLTTPP